MDASDYTLNNPDTLTKYKTAAQISHKVLEAVTGMIEPQTLTQLFTEIPLRVVSGRRKDPFDMREG